MRKHTGSVSTAGRATDWRDQALCVTPTGRDIDFFPTPGDDNGIDKATAICETCPVRMACLRSALREEGGCRPESRHGIRGGLTPDERRRLYERFIRARQRAGIPGRKKQIADCGTISGYQRHKRNGEDACQPCLAAKAAHSRKYKPTATPRQPAQCGTRSGYRRHHRNGEEACEPCRIANTQADRRLRNTGTTLASA